MKAHEMTQVQMGCLSIGHIAALFSFEHSKCPGSAADDP